MGWSAARAGEIFADFRTRRGSRWIASRFALEGLLDEVARRRPRSVLELGPGIGATTRALVDGLDRSVGPGSWRLIVVEENAFCRGELSANLGRDAARVEVVETMADLPDDVTYDFVLIDGPGSLRDHVHRLDRRAAVFVENLREQQRRELDEVLPSPWVARSSWPVLTTTRLGGYHLYRLRPTAAERVSFRVRDRGQHLADRSRPWVRRALARARLGKVLVHFERRDDRGRISESELDDPHVSHEG